MRPAQRRITTPPPATRGRSRPSVFGEEEAEAGRYPTIRIS
jgi:hypothetical protein